MKELDKMISGKIYDPNEESLLKLRQNAHRLCLEFNKLEETDLKRIEILNQLVPENNNCYLQGPIYFDYGLNIKFGVNCYANFNLTILDCAIVEIKDNVFIGPNVSICPPIHPLRYQERNLYQREDGVWTDKEYAKPVTIKSNCWIASNVTICGGVTIGSGCVIASGSVVTRDIPDNSFACGNPCRVIRKITEEDRIKEELY